MVPLRPWRRNEVCKYKETWDWLWRWIKNTSTPRIFGLSEFWGENKKEWVSIYTLLNTFQATDWEFDRNIRPFFTEKFEIEYGEESKLLAPLDSSDCQNREARTKTIYSLNEHYCISFKLSIKILLEEIKPIVTKKSEIEYRQESMKTFNFWEWPEMM